MKNIVFLIVGFSIVVTGLTVFLSFSITALNKFAFSGSVNFSVCVCVFRETTVLAVAHKC